ncbi:MAG: hypothetical protein CSA81_08635 [Acidobacteria bacterium]|nr:MAG: hypothetical protein CSA81_08635 [Acidobacteriota bacterium]
MRNMKKILFLILSISIFSFGTLAQDSKWKVRLRMVSVDPNDNSETIILTEGSYVDVQNDFIPEVDVTYMFTDNWGLEAIAGTSAHSIIAVEGFAAGQRTGEVSLLPPTFTMQYFFNHDTDVHFYLGAGLNYTVFYDYQRSKGMDHFLLGYQNNDPEDDPIIVNVEDLEFSNSFGIALNTGIDGYISDNWLFNVDLKYILIDTTADIIVGGEVADSIDVDINPWLVSIGVGYKF